VASERGLGHAVRLGAPAVRPAAVRRRRAEPRQSPSGRLRPRVGRRILVPVGGRDVELVVVVARRPAARRRARLELRVDGL